MRFPGRKRCICSILRTEQIPRGTRAPREPPRARVRGSFFCLHHRSDIIMYAFSQTRLSYLGNSFPGSPGRRRRLLSCVRAAAAAGYEPRTLPAGTVRSVVPLHRTRSLSGSSSEGVPSDTSPLLKYVCSPSHTAEQLRKRYCSRYGRTRNR